MYPSRKAAYLAFQSFKCGIGQDFYVWRPTGLDQLGRQDSKRTVVGRKGLVEAGHSPAYRGCLLHEIHIQTHLGKVKGSLNTGHTPANYQHRASLGTLLSSHTLLPNKMYSSNRN